MNGPCQVGLSWDIRRRALVRAYKESGGSCLSETDEARGPLSISGGTTNDAKRGAVRPAHTRSVKPASFTQEVGGKPFLEGRFNNAELSIRVGDEVAAICLAYRG